MTNIPDLRFKECVECFHSRRRSTACRGCEAGENFEPSMEELDPEEDFDFVEGDDDE